MFPPFVDYPVNQYVSTVAFAFLHHRIYFPVPFLQPVSLPLVTVPLLPVFLYIVPLIFTISCHTSLCTLFQLFSLLCNQRVNFASNPASQSANVDSIKKNYECLHSISSLSRHLTRYLGHFVHCDVTRGYPLVSC